MEKRKTTWEYGMEFETCMRRVFGDEASYIASSCLNEEYRGQWVSRLLKQLIRDAQDLDTTQKHRERISYLLEALRKTDWKGDDASWGLVFDLLALTAELLGYEGIKGHRTYIPMYWQELQTQLDIGNERGQGERLVQEFHSAAARRVQVVCYLKNQGLNDFEVAMALKTSENEVKKLKKSIYKMDLPDSIKPA
jgi:GNAT superfamily N-acetyltransferase